MFVLAFPTPELPGSGSKGRPRRGLSALWLPQHNYKARYSTERTNVNDIVGLYPFNSFTTVMPSSKWSIIFSAPND
jgi:hypothetical protein